MTTHRLATFATAAALFAAAPLTACAQVNHDSLDIRNDCKRVQQVLKTGHPEAQFDWAINHVGACGEGGAEAGATFIRALASNYTPTAADGGMYLAAQVQAADIFEAGLALAQSNGSTDARLAGFIVTLRQFAPDQGWTLEALRNARPGHSCSGGYISAPGPTVISALPADAGARLKAAAEAIHAAVDTPDQLSKAAQCVAYEVVLAQAAASGN